MSTRVKKKLVEIIIIVHFLFCRHFVPALCARKEKQTHWIKYFKWISKRFVLIVLLYFVKRIIKKKIQSFTSVLWSNAIGCKTCTDSSSRAKKHTLIHPVIQPSLLRSSSQFMQQQSRDYLNFYQFENECGLCYKIKTQ